MKVTDNKIFVNFNEVLKCSDLAILNALKDPELKKQFSNVIDYTRFEFMNNDNLIRLTIEKTTKNILRYLGLIEGYDYDKLYKMLYNNLPSKFISYRAYAYAETLTAVLTSPAVSKLYIYSPEYDEEILTQIGLIFNANNDKVAYIHGNLQKVILDKDISLFIVPDVDMIVDLYEIGAITGKEVLLGNYIYNYEIVGDEFVVKHTSEPLFKDKKFLIKMFVPFVLEDVNFSQIDNNVDPNNNLSLG